MGEKFLLRGPAGQFIHKLDGAISPSRAGLAGGLRAAPSIIRNSLNCNEKTSAG